MTERENSKHDRVNEQLQLLSEEDKDILFEEMQASVLTGSLAFCLSCKMFDEPWEPDTEEQGCPGCGEDALWGLPALLPYVEEVL